MAILRVFVPPAVLLITFNQKSMEISEEFAKLFPKSTWSDEEIAEAMFIPDDERPHFRHCVNKGTLYIDVPIKEYAKQNNLVDLEDFLNSAKILLVMSKNPYEMTYEEFVNFKNGLRKKVHPLKKSINDQAFTTKEE